MRPAAWSRSRQVGLGPARGASTTSDHTRPPGRPCCRAQIRASTSSKRHAGNRPPVWPLSASDHLLRARQAHRPHRPLHSRAHGRRPRPPGQRGQECGAARAVPCPHLQDHKESEGGLFHRPTPMHIDRGLPSIARTLPRGIPGVIDVLDVRAMRWLKAVPTEPGAHTTALDGLRYCLYVFPPLTYRAAVVADDWPIGLSACPLLRAK